MFFSSKKTPIKKFLLPFSLGLAVSNFLLQLPAKAINFTLDKSTITDPVLLWNDALLQAISNTSYGPTPVSRAIGVTNTSIFDAWAAYDELAIGTQLGNTLQVSQALNTEANKKESISYAAYRTLVDLFPSQEGLFNDVMTDLGYDYTNTSTDNQTAAGIGNLVANALINFRHQDGSNQLNNYADTTGYSPVNTPNQVNDPNHWQPLEVEGKVQTFLTPHWGNVTAFALESGNQYLPPPPESFLNPDGSVNQGYIDQALEVLKYNAELTDKEKVIAEYWADGPGTVQPAGHFNLFGEYVSVRDNLSLDENVKLFFGLGNAVMDAGIAAWNAKVHYDYVRPITAIRYLAEQKLLPEDHEYIRTNPNTGEIEIFSWAGPNQGTQWRLGSEWLPYQKIDFVTPAFAEYVSGHSTFSAAGAELLYRFTGSDYFGACHTQPAYSSNYESVTPSTDIELCWDTFSDAANESGISRLYGGIHFHDGNVNGLQLGRKVGTAVWNKSQYYINGGKSIPEPGLIFGLLAFMVAGTGLKSKR